MSVISPLLFSIMTDDIFSQIPDDLDRSLFVDDGVILKRRRKFSHIVGKFNKRYTSQRDVRLRFSGDFLFLFFY